MSDIVEQLRWLAGDEHPPQMHMMGQVTCAQAADEIERLRTVNAELRDTRDGAAIRCSEEITRLRAALRQIHFLDHNEREWESVEEVKAFARAALAAKEKA